MPANAACCAPWRNLCGAAMIGELETLVGSAHKFHGPKGTGFLYVKKSVQAYPLIHGGSQEKGVRAGTENVSGIVGMAKALEIAYAGLAIIFSIITSITGSHLPGCIRAS